MTAVPPYNAAWHGRRRSTGRARRYWPLLPISDAPSQHRRAALTFQLPISMGGSSEVNIRCAMNM
jgi:hypothetical protein